MDIMPLDQSQGNKQLVSQKKQSADIAFKDVIGAKLDPAKAHLKIVPPEFMQHTKLNQKKRKKSLLEVQDEQDIDEDSPYQAFQDLKKTLKKMVAIERQFLDI